MSNLNNAHEGMDEMGDHLDAQQEKKAAAPQPVQTAEDERAAFEAELQAMPEWAPEFEPHRAWVERFAWDLWQARAALASKPVQGGVITCQWEGAEEWMPLAWELCANECGEEACTELIWEGGPIPEPWGDRWLKYEGQAREMIAMVRKHVPGLAAQPVREPMSDKECDEIAKRTLAEVASRRGITVSCVNMNVLTHHDLRRALVRAGAAAAHSHGITKE